MRHQVGWALPWMLAGTFAGAVAVAAMSAMAAVGFAEPRAASTAEPYVLNRIADAVFNHGEVVETAEYLADRIGGRMTNSPAMRQAERWTQEKFRAWGLKDVHTEGFNFGRGWWIESSEIVQLAPRRMVLKGIPLGWTPGTNGPLSAPIIVAPMTHEKDFAEWRGKLAGKIVLVSVPGMPKDDEEVPFQRLNESDIAKLDKYAQPVFDPEARQRLIDRFQFRRKLDLFLAGEGAVGWVTMSRTEGRLIHGEGFGYQVGRTPKLPALELAAEDYRRLTRLAKSGEVTLQIDSKVHYEDADHNAYNVFAEIPGSAGNGSFVLAGAHLDSWVAADGAADNGAGVAVVMEAARILASLDVRPKRTIRFVLWSGEEEGLWGSGAYTERHLAHRPPNADPELDNIGPYFSDTYPVTMLPESKLLDAYFNIDNGSGKIRGIYTEGNFGVVQIFREMLSPFNSLGATSVVAQPTGSTDHVFLSRLGLPAFQFIQDPLDYETRVHHTDADTFDHLRPEDLRQAALVLTTLLVETAMRDQPLPRGAIPTRPSVSDPFHYADPARR